MASNYDDVLGQITGFGLIVNRLDVGRMVRCRIDGDKEKRGWYILHEITLSGGDTVFVGSYGIWQGADANAQKIELTKVELSAEQKAAIKKRIADDKKRADWEQKKRAEQSALRADKAWRNLQTDGDCDYLHRKGIAAHGIRFTEKGALAVPMLDTSGRLHGLQFILDKTKQKELIDKHNGRDKQFWPAGVVKKSHFHLIGSPTDLLLIAEGYATAASLHEATGFPVAVAFDAGNLQSVATALKKRYPHTKFLICADDDSFSACKHCQQPVNINLSPTCPHCNEPHGKRNAGAEFAELAALAVNGRVIAPRFADPAARFDHYCRNQGKLTDFNDLHLTDGLHTVRTQIESALLQFGWSVAAKARDEAPQGGGEAQKLKPIDTTDELLERFSLIYGMSGTVFDQQEHILLKLSDMRDICQSRDIHRRWQESPMRRINRIENVGFDPTEKENLITCNLWNGFPTAPKSGNCENILDLLLYLCGNDRDIYQWILKWMAYPLQHVGAKMKTSLVVHGPQGTGKSLVFETYMKIYGKYGRIIGQFAIEDKHNDWASAKLFLIANEVVARSDAYHVKNVLKAFITDETIRINPKNLAAYEEKNHANVVFLSNERQPVVLEEDDRRHAVVWTPGVLSERFYRDAAREASNGGVEALHDYLLNIDLTGFDEHSKPPMTEAKDELIALSKDNILRFYDDWIGGDIDGVPNVPVLSEDIYDLYKYWCGRQGVKASPMNRAIDHIAKRAGARKERKRYMNGTKHSNPKTFIFPPQCQEMNPGNSETGWLGQCVEDFREAVREYKGGAYD